jgi:SAM-dependent methyltransferase
MKLHLLASLRCPQTGARLAIEVSSRDGDEILEGTLVSPAGQRYAITRGVPRFVASERYAANFGFEWNTHSRIYLDGKDRYRLRSTQAQLKHKLGLSEGAVRGARVLDVGCGTGANALAMAQWGAAEVCCIDLSTAVDAAFANTRHLSNVHVIQADLFHLPFPRESFDVIYSIGVLMATPDTRKAFMSVVPFLSWEGTVAIWVYDDFRGITRWWSDLLRKVTPGMNARLLYALCWLAVPAYYVYRIPVLGKLMFHFLPPVSKEPYWEDRVLDTFDWYSPTYQWKHTYPEVYSWFQEAGLADVHLLDFPVSMWGRKAATLSSSQPVAEDVRSQGAMLAGIH